MIISLGFLADHKYVVQQQGAPQRRALHDLDVLELGLRVVQQLAVRDAQPRVLAFLKDPLLLDQLLLVGSLHVVVGDEVVPLGLHFLFADAHVLHQPPGDISRFIVQAFKLLREDINTSARSHLGGACEHIDSGVFELRPGVNSDVRLGYDYDSTHSEGVEVVELRADDSRIAGIRTIKEALLNLDRVI